MDTGLYTNFASILRHDDDMKTAENPNIRISARAKAALKMLSKQEGKPMQAVLDEAIERYQRDKFFDEVNASFLRRPWKRPQSMARGTSGTSALGQYTF